MGTHFFTLNGPERDLSKNIIEENDSKSLFLGCKKVDKEHNYGELSCGLL